jgi:hypothetical protein
MIRSALAVVLAALLACNGRPQPIERVSVPDNTTSSHASEMSVKKEAQAFLGELVPGSRFTVMPVACTSDLVEIIYDISVPLRFGSGAAQKRRAWLEAEERHLETLRLRRPERCSGVVGAIWRASRFLQESGRPVKELYINSDLREVSPELGPGVNFEKTIPAPEDFLLKVKEKNLLPDLHGVRVYVYGVHDEASPDSRRWTSQQAAALRAAWTAFFKAAGVDHVEFRAASTWEKAEPANVAWGGLR